MVTFISELEDEREELAPEEVILDEFGRLDNEEDDEEDVTDDAVLDELFSFWCEVLVSFLLLVSVSLPVVFFLSLVLLSICLALSLSVFFGALSGDL